MGRLQELQLQQRLDKCGKKDWDKTEEQIGWASENTWMPPRGL